MTGTESGNITLDQYTAHEFISGNELGTVSAADACTDGDRCFHSFPIEDCVAEKVCQIYLIATGSKENRIVTSNMESISKFFCMFVSIHETQSVCYKCM